MSALATEKDAVAKALYLEFRQDQYTYQLVIVPSTVSLDKTKVHPLAYMARKISVHHPRRNWNFTIVNQRSSFVHLPTRDADGNFEQWDENKAKAYAEENLHYALRGTLNSLVSRGWVLFKTPITVEVTYKDIQSFSARKTPNELFRRITRTRDALGWGEGFFNETTPAPLAPTSTPATITI